MEGYWVQLHRRGQEEVLPQILRKKIRVDLVRQAQEAPLPVAPVAFQARFHIWARARARARGQPTWVLSQCAREQQQMQFAQSLLWRLRGPRQAVSASPLISHLQHAASAAEQ